jgi:hypothetical protein
MAFPTTDVRIESGPFRLFAIRSYLDSPLKGRCKGTGHLTTQVHELADVGPVNGWYRASTAQGAHPGRPEQAAFFMVTTAIVVAIEIFTFRTGWCLHMFNVPQTCGTSCFYTRVM